MFTECWTINLPWEPRGDLNLEPMILFGVNGHLFISHMYLEKNLPRKLQGLSWENEKNKEQKMKFTCVSLLLWLTKVLIVLFQGSCCFKYVSTYVHLHPPSLKLAEIGYAWCLKNGLRMNMISVCIYVADRYGWGHYVNCGHCWLLNWTLEHLIASDALSCQPANTHSGDASLSATLCTVLLVLIHLRKFIPSQCFPSLTSRLE